MKKNQNVFNPFPDDKNLTLSKFKAFTDDKVYVTLHDNSCL